VYCRLFVIALNLPLPDFVDTVFFLFFGGTLVVLQNNLGGDGSCHGLVLCDMPIKNVRLLGVNTMAGSWSVYKDEVSCMEVSLVLLY
jgi:hypothetical protein